MPVPQHVLAIGIALGRGPGALFSAAIFAIGTIGRLMNKNQRVPAARPGSGAEAADWQRADRLRGT